MSSKLRCEGDARLAEQLLDQPIVKNVRRQIDEQAELDHPSTRRHLLATALRVTQSMSPKLHATADRCAQRLGVSIPLELYVYPAAEFNAACVKPEAGRLFVLLSSALLESFEDDELTFVMGHELGHHVFGHHDIPIGQVLRGKSPPPPDVALQLFTWSRYAEISADRAGAACATEPNAVARALFRLASGLRGGLGPNALLQINIDDFAQQADEMKTESSTDKGGAPESDWFSTHPFSPLRLKAAKLFFDSDLYQSGGMPNATLEANIQTLMAVMEPGYLKERTSLAEAMRRLLFAACICVIDADNQVSEAERKAFEAFFGPDSLSDKLDLDAIKADLHERTKDAVDSIPLPKRIQVLRDTCTLARAQGKIGKDEELFLSTFASDLEVPREVYEQALYHPFDLD